MINKKANILFMPTSPVSHGAESRDLTGQQGYYQRLIHASLARTSQTIEGFQILGKQLADIARRACMSRDIEAVEQTTQLMLALPIADQLEGVARHYQAWCIWRRGDRVTARRSFEREAEETQEQYRARALQVIGLTYHECGDVDAALAFYLAAGKAASSCDLLTFAEAQKMAAVVRSIQGDHKQALADLENLFPLVRAIGRFYPATYYDFLNSLAVELAEASRLDEAFGALAIALASPFASANPEWSETRDEIAVKRASAATSLVFGISRAPEAGRRQPIRQKLKLKRLVLNWVAAEETSNRKASVEVAVSAASALHGNQRILERMLICIAPRAPPALF